MPAYKHFQNNGSSSGGDCDASSCAVAPFSWCDVPWKVVFWCLFTVIFAVVYLLYLTKRYYQLGDELEDADSKKK